MFWFWFLLNVVFRFLFKVVFRFLFKVVFRFLFDRNSPGWRTDLHLKTGLDAMLWNEGIKQELLIVSTCSTSIIT